MIHALQSYISRLWNDDDGATMVEYALMLGLIVGLVAAIVTVIGNKTYNAMQQTNNVMTGF